MKILLILFLTFNIFANELKWVDEQVSAIKPARKGVAKAKIYALHDPFIFLKEIKKKKKTKHQKKSLTKVVKTPQKAVVTKESIILNLEAIINNSVLINGKWYKLGDKVGLYQIVDVDRTKVILTHGIKKLILSTRTKNRTLKFNNN
jgi:hypothetical protein